LRVWRASGDAMRAGAPLGMLADLVRQGAGVDATGPLEARKATLRACVEAAVRAADVERVTVFLAELAGAPFAPEASLLLATAREDAMLMGDQMRRAFEDWLEAECARDPVLLVLEDLHFGDLSTVRFIDAALRHLRDRPFVVLGLARPEVSRVFAGLWSERALTEIRLGELGRRASEQVVRLSLGASVSAATVASILERAGGNPFYLEEIVRAVAGGRSPTALPGTVLATVQARLEELDPAGRRVLRAGSVFGDVFWPAAVAALLGAAKPTSLVDQELADLIEREFVVRRGQSRFLGHEELAFRNALVREAAYASLTDADRMLGHRLAGAWLSAAGEPSPRVLAEHFERGGEPLRAAEQYGRAARDALEGNDFAAVVDLVERAIASGASGEQAGLLRMREAEAQRWRSEFAEAERRGFEAIALLPEGGDAWMAAVGEMATVLGKLGKIERVAELAGALLRHCRRAATPSDAEVAALSRTATSLLLMGRFDLADALFDALAAAVGDADMAAPPRAAWYWRARAFRAPFRGEVGASARQFMLSALAFDRMGDVRNACLQRANFGSSCLEVGDYEASERALRPTIAEAERMGAHHIVSSAKRDLGYALARMGRLDDARCALLDAVQEFAAHGDRRLEGAGRDELAFVRMQQGDLEGAECEARAAVERLEVAPPYQCHARATLSRVLLRRGNAEEAVGEATHALAILKEVGALEEGEGLVRLALAEALWAVGREDEARLMLGEARQEIERRARAIDDPGARRTFVENIPEHAETAALARERLGGFENGDQNSV
jgi:tetratricopeptide (TPR) repeat protein